MEPKDKSGACSRLACNHRFNTRWICSATPTPTTRSCVSAAPGAPRVLPVDDDKGASRDGRLGQEDLRYLLVE